MQGLGLASNLRRWGWVLSLGMLMVVLALPLKDNPETLAQSAPDPVIELQEQRQTLERSRAEANEQQQQLQTQEAATQEQLGGLQQKLKGTNQQLQNNEQQLQQAQTKLVQLEADLKLAQLAYEAKQQSTVARLRWLQRQRHASTWAALLQSKTLEQLLERQRQLKLVYEADQQALITLETKKEELSEKTLKVEEQKNKVALLSQRLLAQKADYEAQAQAQQQFLLRLQQDRQALEAAERQLAEDARQVTRLIQQKTQAIQRQQIAVVTSSQRPEAATSQLPERATDLLPEPDPLPDPDPGQRPEPAPPPLAEPITNSLPKSGPDRLPDLATSGIPAPSTARILGTGRMSYPSNGPISSNFGWRVHPIFGTSKFHSGTDFAAPQGAPIQAADRGTVIFAGWRGGYGNAVILDHGSGLTTLYGHASQLYVTEGEAVQKGQTIAAVGSTGFSTGPHLHFEVRLNGEPTNPLAYL